MKTYPINLLLKNRNCLIVGGGKVAIRKLTALILSKASITIIDPKISIKLKNIALENDIVIHEREFKKSDIDGVYLIYAATNDRRFNLNLISMGEKHNILACSVDSNWEKGSFITPASINHNDITISVSSQGVACRKTKLIKDNLARHIDLIEDTGLMVIGTDHNLIDIDRRKYIHLTGDRMDNAGKLIMTLWGVHEFMLLNTCNRIEVIAAAYNDNAIIEMIKMILKLELLEPKQYYIKFGFEAFKHMCLVTSGLLSQTPGENHITAQFKESFEYGKERDWSSTLMTSLHSHILHVSKDIRNNIIHLLKVFEIEELVIAFLKKRLPLNQESTSSPIELKGKHILLIGTGVIGVAMKNMLIKEGCTIDWIYRSNAPTTKKSTISNEVWIEDKLFLRESNSDPSKASASQATIEKSKNMQLDPLMGLKDQGVTSVQLNMLGSKLPDADILISALSSEHPVISKDMAHFFKDGVELIDLGSPRNIDSGLKQFKNIKLTDMEDLKHWHRKHNCDMTIILEKAISIIDEHKDIYEKFRKSFINGRQGE